MSTELLLFINQNMYFKVRQESHALFHHIFNICTLDKVLAIFNIDIMVHSHDAGQGLSESFE